MERVANVLGHMFPRFNTISPNHFVSDALYQMCAENLDYLVVMEEEKFCGIISGSDIAGKVLFAEQPLKEIKVKEFMNRNIPVVMQDDTIEHSLHLLKQYNAKYLAVYDRFDFKGVVSSFDLMQQVVTQRGEEIPKEQTFTWSY